MNHRFLTSLRIQAVPLVVALLLVACRGDRQPPDQAAGGKVAETGTQPRTPWGHPDLQGMWTSNAVEGVPMERPVDTPEGVAGRKAQEEARNEGDPGGANVVWNYDPQPTLKHRPASLVVDPPDGRIPVTPEAQRLLDDREKWRYGIDVTSWKNFDLWDRCITKGFPTVMIPMGHNNAYQIFQTPDYVAILHEIIHDVRTIPLDGRPHVDHQIRQYYGDSRGRWEGNTLVVDVTNINENGFGLLQRAGSYRGGSKDLHVVERFTRVDANTIDYRATLEDPRVFTKPWTMAVPLVRDDGYKMFEYACHEGNYGMINILSAVASGKQPRLGGR